ncbi:hypothetical protein HPB51_005909 [Rhipicephalus microplus]|uniref:CCHC-type domain-containing protein n=1 Tax=Rhipicephalus microplus TaxID=6941 RepID=A0A9J6D3S6_RHIMP|nr:hypothetical protein HPB51_005909 [Rhipicephalus microplus]
METDKLTAIGKELGLSGPGLKRWIDEERVREREAREVRLAERNAAKEADAEALARLQAEKEVLELRLKLRELDATTDCPPPSRRASQGPGLARTSPVWLPATERRFVHSALNPCCCYVVATPDIYPTTITSSQGLNQPTASWSPNTATYRLLHPQRVTRSAARRTSPTNFTDGDQVPFHVYYRGAEYECYLHKKRTEVCDKCGAVGHRSDVCPKPNAVTCTLCGTANPATAHPCTLMCLLCGQALHTGDKTCPQRYRTPRLLIYRRQEKAKLQQQQYLSTMIPTQDAHPERQEVKPSDTRSRSTSPTSKRRG